MKSTHRILTLFIAAVWLANGLFSKVLNLVPRHQQIVADILGPHYSRPLTIAIGLLETGMAIWTISKFRSRLNAVMQITLVAVMNILEFVFVPDLLLWGRFNALFAFLFILIVYFNEFHLRPNNYSSLTT